MQYSPTIKPNLPNMKGRPDILESLGGIPEEQQLSGGGITWCWTPRTIGYSAPLF